MLTYLGQWLWCLPVLAAMCLSSCSSDGHINILGYTTRPNYDPNIHTVYVPMFENRTYRDNSRQGLEQQLTRAVVQQIEARTPFKVVSSAETADTELKGVITSYNKTLLDINQLNEVRDAETDLMVEVVWKDLRTGDILSQRRKRLDPLPPPIDTPVAVPPPVKVVPASITSTTDFIPELGGSMASARKANTDLMAIEIVSMMEKPW